MRDLREGAVADHVPALVAAPLKVVSRRDPIRVPPATTLADAIAAIHGTGTGDSVFVTDDQGTLVGVLTERDIFGQLVLGDVDLAQPIESLMTTNPQRLNLEQPVRAAIQLMQTGRYRNLPLVDDDDRLVGVVRPQDILNYLAEAFPTELLNLPPRPHQKMEQPEGG